jgi:hypothetical protein
MGRARVEAAHAGKKAAVVGAAGAALILLGWVAKRRVGR